MEDQRIDCSVCGCETEPAVPFGMLLRFNCPKGHETLTTTDGLIVRVLNSKGQRVEPPKKKRRYYHKPEKVKKLRKPVTIKPTKDVVAAVQSFPVQLPKVACLKCRKMFVPSSRFNRICPQCTHENKGKYTLEPFKGKVRDFEND
jgi:hypothetical protein